MSDILVEIIIRVLHSGFFDDAFIIFMYERNSTRRDYRALIVDFAKNSSVIKSRMLLYNSYAYAQLRSSEVGRYI